jgi:Late competence development protein ComFB.
MTEGKEKPINVVKEIALDFLPGVMKNVGLEDTPENREDILALALNKLQQKYVTTSSGRVYAEMINNFRTQYQTDILSMLTKAAITVKERPRGSDTSREEK